MAICHTRRSHDAVDAPPHDDVIGWRRPVYAAAVVLMVLIGPAAVHAITTTADHSGPTAPPSEQPTPPATSWPDRGQPTPTSGGCPPPPPRRAAGPDPALMRDPTRLAAITGPALPTTSVGSVLL